MSDPANRNTTGVNPANTDPLDVLLAQARWPEMGAGRVRRLHDYWRQISRKGQWMSAAAAAILLIAAIVSGIVVSGIGVPPDAHVAVRTVKPQADTRPSALRKEGGTGQKNPPQSPLSKGGSLDGKGGSAEQADPPQSPLRKGGGLDGIGGSGREPTVIEQLAFAAATRTRGPIRLSEPDPRELRQRQRDLDRLLGMVARALTPEPLGRAGGRRCAEEGPRIVPLSDDELSELVSPLLADRWWHEQALGTIASETTASETTASETIASETEGYRQAAALRLLGHVGGARSVPLLRALLRLPGTHAGATRALIRLDSPLVLANMARSETDRGLRHEILAELATRPSGQAVSLFLSCVGEPSLREQALAVIWDLTGGIERPEHEMLSARIASLPLDAYFDILTGSNADDRRLAAAVLARVRDPQVTRRLIGMAVGSPYQREAMLALVESPALEASNFVWQARRDAYLLASLRGAEQELGRINELFTTTPRSFVP